MLVTCPQCKKPAFIGAIQASSPGSTFDCNRCAAGLEVGADLQIQLQVLHETSDTLVPSEVPSEESEAFAHWMPTPTESAAVASAGPIPLALPSTGKSMDWISSNALMEDMADDLFLEDGEYHGGGGRGKWIVGAVLMLLTCIVGAGWGWNQRVKAPAKSGALDKGLHNTAALHARETALVVAEASPAPQTPSALMPVPTRAFPEAAALPALPKKAKVREVEGVKSKVEPGPENAEVKPRRRRRRKKRPRWAKSSSQRRSKTLPSKAIGKKEAAKPESDIDPSVSRASSFAKPSAGHKAYEEGNRLLFANKIALAIARLKECVQKEPDFALGYRSLGIAQLKMGRQKAAIEAYSQFVRLAPAHRDAPALKQMIQEYQATHGAP